MRLPELCIRRPVFATVINLVILLIGIIAYQRLTVREYPNIDEPVVSVSTTFRGASAEIIELQLTQPLEESLSGIEGIDFIKSTSRAESSRISITFRSDRDIDAAAADVRDRVSRARGKLPEAEPLVDAIDAGKMTLYRARLTGLTHTSARQACEQLKREKMTCSVVSPDA